MAATNRRQNTGCCRDSWWPNNGHIGQTPAQVQTYRELASGSAVKTICEIGFNAGHSSVTLLSAQQDTVLVSFDLQELPYSQQMVSHVKNLFGDRFQLIKGNSIDVFPAFLTAGGHCDLVSVDGQHDRTALTDLLNGILLSDVGGMLVADDVSNSFSLVRDSWQDLVDGGYLGNSTCIEGSKQGGYDKRWCFATILRKHGIMDGELKLPPFIPQELGDQVMRTIRSQAYAVQVAKVRLSWHWHHQMAY